MCVSACAARELAYAYREHNISQTRNKKLQQLYYSTFPCNWHGLTFPMSNFTQHGDSRSMQPATVSQHDQNREQRDHTVHTRARPVDLCLSRYQKLHILKSSVMLPLVTVERRRPPTPTQKTSWKGNVFEAAHSTQVSKQSSSVHHDESKLPEKCRA